jgi:hypothetical protein
MLISPPSALPKSFRPPPNAKPFDHFDTRSRPAIPTGESPQSQMFPRHIRNRTSVIFAMFRVDAT